MSYLVTLVSKKLAAEEIKQVIEHPLGVGLTRGRGGRCL